MQRDAKFGLVLGVVMVLVIAVVFSRQEPTSAAMQPETTAVTTSQIGGPPAEAAVANAALSH